MTWVRASMAVLFAAALITFIVFMVKGPPTVAQLYPAPQQTAPATFTWEGTTWDCGQVSGWDAQYGAYEPDGTPIPYEVLTSCDG